LESNPTDAQKVINQTTGGFRKVIRQLGTVYEEAQGEANECYKGFNYYYLNYLKNQSQITQTHLQPIHEVTDLVDNFFLVLKSNSSSLSS